MTTDINRGALIELGHEWINSDSPTMQARGNEILALLTPSAGALMVARASAGARAVLADEALRRAEAPVVGKGVARATYPAALEEFVEAFRALDANHAALAAVSPRDADPARHRGAVAFILRARLDKIERAAAGPPLAPAVVAVSKLYSPLAAAGGTAAELGRGPRPFHEDSEE